MNFLIKLIDRLFLFYSVAAPQKNEAEKIEQVHKARVAVAASFMAATVNFSLFILSFFFQFSNFSEFSNQFLSIGLVLFLAPWLIRKKGYRYYHVLSAGIVIIALVALPIRIYFSGGIFSFFTMFAAIPIMLTGMFYGRKGLIVVFLYWCVYAYFLYHSHLSGAITPITLDSLPTSAFSMGLGFLGVGVITYIFVMTQNYYQKRVSEVGKAVMVQQFSAALSHEINNPLFVAKMMIEKSIKLNQMTESDREKINKSLDRVSTVVKGIQSLEDNQEKLVTVSYAGQTDMLDIPLGDKS